MVNELKIIDDENIENLIYEIRGKQVMLDSDLARLYKCTNGTKDINKAVKRNINKFPEDFYFQLTDEEKNLLWFQTGTANKMSRNNPYVFTEEGVAMLSSILHTEVAIETSIKIIRAFVKMRHLIRNNIDYFKDIGLIEKRLIIHDNKIDDIDNNVKLLKESFNKLEDKKIKNKILFKGQYYDAYSFLLDILNSAKNEIIIIDNYTDKKTLDLICKTKNNVLIVSKNMDDELIKKYCNQYNNLTIKQSDEFHDRFIIVDKKLLYHLGASLKDLGKGCFGINMIDNINIINELLNEIKKDLN